MISSYGEPQFVRDKRGALPVWRYALRPTLDALAARQPLPQLSPREKRECAAYRNPRRLQEYYCGRLLGKQLIAEQLGNACANQIEIFSRDSAGRAIRPRASLAGRPLPFSLSIAHTDRGVLAAVCRDTRLQVGVDMMPRGPLSRGFARLWFTRAEQAWFDRAGASEIGCLLWASKEAVFKACNCGESFDPTVIEILPCGAARYRGRALASLRLRSWEIDGHVAVVASVEDGEGLPMPRAMTPAVDTYLRHMTVLEPCPLFKE